MTTEIQTQFERYTLENTLRREREGIPLDRTNAILRILEEYKHYFPLTVIRTQNENFRITLLPAYRMKAGVSEPALYVSGEALYVNDTGSMMRCVTKPFPERFIRELLSILSERERAEETYRVQRTEKRPEVILEEGIFLFRYLVDPPAAPELTAKGFRRRILEYKPVEAAEIGGAKERLAQFLKADIGKKEISGVEVYLEGKWEPLEITAEKDVLPLITPRMFSPAASADLSPVLIFRR